MCCKGFLIVLFGVNYFAFGQFNIKDDCRSQSAVDWPYSYSGTRHTTVTGKTCKYWRPDHSSYGPLNYCRALKNDPDSAHGPWCYSNVGGWEYCYIPVCDIDCQVSTEDKNYRGSLNVTKSGFTCRKWSYHTSPHNNEPTYHQNETLNFCRTPADDTEPTPWCYTTSNDKKWEKCNVPLCSAITTTKCPDLRQEPNMILPKRLTGYFYQAQVTFQCDRGYSLSSAESMTCLASTDKYDGHWSGTQPKCLPKSTNCPNLQPERNMILPTKLAGYVYQDQVFFQCTEGYSLSSAHNLTCLASSPKSKGYWSEHQPSCLRMNCPNLRPDPNMISPTKLTGYVYQDRVAFQCADGYLLSFKDNLTCLASSNQNIVYWSKTQPSCLRKKCPDLKKDPNMILPTKLFGYVYQDQVPFKCAEGYLLSSAEILICQASSHQNNGHWNKTQPSCMRKRCPDLNPVPNMILPTNLTGYVYQGQVAFQCAEGYSLSFKENLICQASSQKNMGHWSRNQPTCQPVTCPGLNQMPNQNLTPVQTKYSYRDTVIFKCDEGYRLSSADIITCQSDGLWSDNQTSCTVEKGQPNKDSGKRNGVYMSYGLFGGILAAIVIISTAVHIGTCYYYRNRLRKHVTVYEDIKFNTVERQNYSNAETYAELT